MKEKGERIIERSFEPAVSSSASRWLQLATLTLWLSLVGGGLLGFSLPYASPEPPAGEPELPPVEAISIELTTHSDVMAIDREVVSDLSDPVPLEPPVDAPPAPELTSALAPSVDVAFPLPIETPSQVVQETKLADASRPTTESVDEGDSAAREPAPTQLTFGSGEGRQPAPRYPSRSLRDGQEGAVTVVFTVGENGRVSEVDVTEPCEWPLLNREAARVIQNRWRFTRGSIRRYEVTIRFQIQV